jgi:hypothetical protein
MFGIHEKLVQGYPADMDPQRRGIEWICIAQATDISRCGECRLVATFAE